MGSVDQKIRGIIYGVISFPFWFSRKLLEAAGLEWVMVQLRPWQMYAIEYGIPALFVATCLWLLARKPGKIAPSPQYVGMVSISNGWPRLNDNHRLLISEILAAGNRAGKVEILYSTDEGALFAKDFAECLREQRWDVSSPRRSMPESFFEGIQLRTVADTDSYGTVELSGVRILAEALMAIKLRTILVSRGGVHHDTSVVVAIGHWVKNS